MKLSCEKLENVKRSSENFLNHDLGPQGKGCLSGSLVECLVTGAGQKSPLSVGQKL